MSRDARIRNTYVKAPEVGCDLVDRGGDLGFGADVGLVSYDFLTCCVGYCFCGLDGIFARCVDQGDGGACFGQASDHFKADSSGAAGDAGDFVGEREVGKNGGGGVGGGCERHFFCLERS